MSKPIIEVEHLSKCYRIGATREPYLSPVSYTHLTLPTIYSV